MTWSKVDDGFYDHPKTVAAGPLGIALFICALSYSSRYLTDGFIAEAMTRRLIDVDDPQAVAEKLVEVGLWEQAEGGYQIHDYLDYNPSRQKVLETREARAEAGRLGGQQSGEAKKQANGEQKPSKSQAKAKQKPSKTEAKRQAKQQAKTNPDPDPDPDPKPETEKTAPAKAGEPPPKSRKTKTRQKKPLPTAVKVFRENAHRYPAKAWYENVADVVGDKPADLERWGQVVKAYVGLGWNPTNVSGMLDWFERNEIPHRRKDIGPEPYAGIKEWVAEQEAVL